MAKLFNLKVPVPLHRMSIAKKRNDNVRYNMIPMTKAMAKTLANLDGVEMQYGRSGSFSTDDPGVAQALQDKYGKKHLDVWEVKDRHYHPADKGHR